MTSRTTSEPEVYCTFLLDPKTKPPFEVDCYTYEQAEKLKDLLDNDPDWETHDYKHTHYSPPSFY